MILPEFIVDILIWIIFLSAFIFWAIIFVAIHDSITKRAKNYLKKKREKIEGREEKTWEQVRNGDAYYYDKDGLSISHEEWKIKSNDWVYKIIRCTPLKIGGFVVTYWYGESTKPLENGHSMFSITTPLGQNGGACDIHLPYSCTLDQVIKEHEKCVEILGGEGDNRKEMEDWYLMQMQKLRINAVDELITHIKSKEEDQQSD